MAIYVNLSDWPKHYDAAMAALRAYSLVNGTLADGTRIDDAWWRDVERLATPAVREEAAKYSLSIPYNTGPVNEALMWALEDFLAGPLLLGAWKRQTGRRAPEWMLIVPFEFAPDGVPWMEFPGADGSGLFVGNACDFVHHSMMAADDDWGEDARAKARAAFEQYRSGRMDDADSVALGAKLVVEHAMFDLLRLSWRAHLPVSLSW